MFRQIEKAIRGIARFGAWYGGAMMLVAAAIIGAEVVLRKLFLVSFGGTDEMASYALALGTVWALPFALIERAHIRIDVLYTLFPKRIISFFDIVALLATLVFASVLTWYAIGVFTTSWKFNSTANTPIGTPLWIPQGIWSLGLIIFVLTICILLVESLQALASGDYPKISEIAGTKSIKEELDEEILSIDRIINRDDVDISNTKSVEKA